MDTEPLNEGVWSENEHDRLLAAKARRLRWREIAEHVGTRSLKQCISHWQKFKKKVDAYRERGSARASRREHRIPVELVTTTENNAGLANDLSLLAVEPTFPVEDEDTSTLAVAGQRHVEELRSSFFGDQVLALDGLGGLLPDLEPIGIGTDKYRIRPRL